GLLGALLEHLDLDRLDRVIEATITEPRPDQIEERAARTGRPRGRQDDLGALVAADQQDAHPGSGGSPTAQTLTGSVEERPEDEAEGLELGQLVIQVDDLGDGLVGDVGAQGAGTIAPGQGLEIHAGGLESPTDRRWRQRGELAEGADA